MRILICCEFYAPSTGGVQKVMQEIGEHLALRGHEVTVATSRLPQRTFKQLNGVTIREFEISGNLVRGLRGEADAYRDFVLRGGFDAILIKAAQQWSFDALWEVLPYIKARKVHIPCGYSSLLDPAYADYYGQMPDVLRRFDHLIYYAGQYRDIDFARQHGIAHCSIIPNGASDIEFAAAPAVDIRGQLKISGDEFIFLTVGNPPFQKGHGEIARAYELLQLPFDTALILNGAYTATDDPDRWSMPLRAVSALKRLKRKILQPAHRQKSFADTISTIRREPGKRVIIADLPRQDLLAAFFAADLFVFASHIEYSPLVLYEAAAAGLPFLTVPAGNAAEIAQWTGGGEICPAPADALGYLQPEPQELGRHMARLAIDRHRLDELGAAGRKNWLERFTWEKIALQYEQVLKGEAAAHV